jgi:hypothetical protein
MGLTRHQNNCIGILESHWRKIKLDYLHRFNRPRLDLVVWVLLSRSIPDSVRNMQAILDREHRIAIASWRKAFKWEWKAVTGRLKYADVTFYARWIATIFTVLTPSLCWFRSVTDVEGARPSVIKVDPVVKGACKIMRHACTLTSVTSVTSAKFLGKPATCPWPQANRASLLGQVLIMCTIGKRDGSWRLWRESGRMGDRLREDGGPLSH